MGAELIAVFLIAAAFRGLVEQTRRDLAAWRHRPPPAKGGRKRGRVTTGQAGYWGHQALHGFPTARHGLTDGWMRGREAHHQALRGIAQSRAEHAEGKNELHPELEEYRRRRKEALKDLWDKQRWQKPQQPGRDRDDRGREPENEQRPPDKDQTPDKDRDKTQDPDHDDKTKDQDPAKDPDNDKTPDDDKDDPAQPEPGQQAPAAPKDGDGPVSETTYEGVKARMTAAMANAEQRQAEAEAAANGCEERVADAERAKAWAETTADEMQALEVDGAVLNAMAEHLAAMDAALQAEQALQEAAQQAKAAWTSAVESAQNVIAQLESSGHGAVQEAHDNAANQGAKKEFYTEG